MEDKIIAKKLSELETLPEGYMPNLDSKWAILESGLNKHKKNKHIIYAWRSIAASLFIVCTLGFYLLMKPTEVTPLVEKKVLPKTEPTVQQKIVSSFQTSEKEKGTPHKKNVADVKKLPVIKKQVTVKTMLPETSITAVNLTEDTLQKPTEEHPEQLASTQTPLKRKKQRYIQMDFNDPVSEINQASDQRGLALGFRINLFNNNNYSSTNSNPSNPTKALARIKF